MEEARSSETSERIFILHRVITQSYDMSNTSCDGLITFIYKLVSITNLMHNSFIL
jgi:hypothetical protein